VPVIDSQIGSWQYLGLFRWHVSIVLKPGPARRVDLGPGRPEAGTGPGWRKNRKSHDPVWPGRLGELTRQNPVATRWLLFFLFCFFFTKMTPFRIFFKIGIDLADPATRSKPGDPVQTRNPGLGPGRV